MTQDLLQLDVLTPAGPVFSGNVGMVEVPATLGLMSVLPEHAPLMTTIEIGPLLYHKDGAGHYIAVTGGFVEVLDNKVVVLAKVAEAAENIDVARAKAAAERAHERLDHPSPDIDVVRAERALSRALNRLKVASYNKTRD